MKILYISKLCPDTEPALEVLKREGIEYEVKDITLSLSHMKEFLALRDSRVEFTPIKEKGNIGIPLLLSEDGDLRFDF